MQYVKKAAFWAAMGLTLLTLGMGAAAALSAAARQALTSTLAGAQIQQVAADTEPFIWHQVGTYPFVKGGGNDSNVYRHLSTPRARACAMSEGIPGPVWNMFLADLKKNPRALHSTMKTNATFDQMAFGPDCTHAGGTWYTGPPVAAYVGSYTYRGHLWTIGAPNGCLNIFANVERVKTVVKYITKTVVKYVIKTKVIVKKIKVEVPRKAQLFVASMFAKSNSLSRSEAEANCPAGTVSAQALAGAYAYAYARAIGFGFGDAQRRAYAYAVAKTGTSTSTKVACNVPVPTGTTPPTVPPTTTSPPVTTTVKTTTIKTTTTQTTTTTGKGTSTPTDPIEPDTNPTDVTTGPSTTATTPETSCPPGWKPDGSGGCDPV